MTVSMVVVTYNKSFRLRLMLESLKILKVDNLVELIIVDDGSTDQTQQVINEFFKHSKLPFKVSVFKITNQGRSGARNFGARNAKGEIIIFVDDDMILSHDFVKMHRLVHESHREEIIVRGSILDIPYIKFFEDPINGTLYEKDRKISTQLLSYCIDPNDICINFNKIISHTKMSKFEKDIQRLYEVDKCQAQRWIGCTGANISVSKSLFEKLEGFDILLGKKWGCEDLEFGYRAYQGGYKSVFAKEAVNIHQTHLRKDFLEKHNEAMAYFISKYNSDELRILNKYFNGEIKSLEEWSCLINGYESTNATNEWL